MPFPPPGELPDPGVEPTLPVSPTLAGRFFTDEQHGQPLIVLIGCQIKILNIGIMLLWALLKRYLFCDLLYRKSIF